MFKRKFTSLLKSNNPEVVGLIEALQYDAVWFQEEGNPKFEIMNPYGDGSCMLLAFRGLQMEALTVSQRYDTC